MILLCLMCSALHEAGHLVLIWKYNGKPECIDIKPGEVKINCNQINYTPRQDLLVTGSGVLFNFIGSTVSFLVYAVTHFNLFFNLAVCNLCIGTFNLLPVKSFDGGQLLSNLLARKLSVKTTDCILNIITVLTIIPLATLGFYILLVSRYNYTLLIVAIYTITIILSNEMR